MQAASEVSKQLSPLGLHLLALASVFALSSLFRAKPRAVRLTVGLGFFAAILAAGFWKTSCDENVFRLLKIDRRHSVRDIQVGLDRLEDSLDEEAVLEMESSLTGNSSAYYFKGSFE